MTTVAEYLAARLGRLGVRHLFGVPGDFSLGLVEHLTAPGRLEWVGTANELDAGYAADGYARLAGLGALCTTFGVGELSALNAVAGAYAEHVPVVHVSGTPATGPARAGALLHHTLADGRFDRTLRAFAEFTAAADVLTGAADAAARVDAVLQAALDTSRPVHLGIPADLVAAELDPADAARLDVPLVARAGDAAATARFASAVEDLLAAAGPGARPVLLVGHLVHRVGAADRVRALARAGGWPVALLLSARGVLDERGAPDGPGEVASGEVVGWYAGDLGPAGVRELVATADPLITVGAVLTDVVSGFFTHRPDPARSITLDLDGATVAGRRVDGVRLGDALAALTAVATRPAPRAGAGARAATDAATDAATGTATGTGNGNGNAGHPAPRPDRHPGAPVLAQADLWAGVGRWLPAGGTLVADIGTAFWGAAALALPPDTAVVTQPVWSSIGYAVPAALGAALAAPGRRPVLLVGDGAAQMTAAELGLLARRAPGAVVVLVDNSGYTIERMLREPHAAHHDVTRWDWPALLRALAPDLPAGHEPAVVTVRDPAGLAEALRRAGDEPKRLSLVHVVTDPLDAPPLLHALARAATGGSRP